MFKRILIALPILASVFIFLKSSRSREDLQGITDSNTCNSFDSDTCTSGLQSVDNDVKHQMLNTAFDDQWDEIKNTKSPLKKLYVDCVDNHEQCKMWSEKGECADNPYHMIVNCRKSCGECIEYDVDMGVPQMIDGKDSNDTLNIFKKSLLYKKDEIVAQPAKHKHDVQSECLNRHELCAFWAAIGECVANPNYMKIQCGPSCRSCHMIDINNRCPLDPNTVDALGPNDLDQMFLQITDIYGPFKDYEPIVHSHPSGIVNSEKIKYGENPILDGPWVVTFESFHTDEESERLIEMGSKLGYERSTDVGKRKFDGTYDNSESTSRTSHNAWCVDDCQKDPLAQKVAHRIGNVTGISFPNHENLQLLRYTEGQFYRTHHDFIPHQVDRQPGPRVLTFFLYLNDVVEGGATRFPLLKREEGGLKIYPKKGRALLWPSIMNSNPNQKDVRTKHEAMSVVKGTKYGANAWIHLRDFQTPNDAGCA